MRDELLNESLFLGLDHARSRIANWIDDYNQRRPHSALGYLTPTAYAANLSATRAPRRKPRRGSKRLWMKVQWQVKDNRFASARAIRFAKMPMGQTFCGSEGVGGRGPRAYQPRFRSSL
jgi:hypothetical protein